MLTARDRLISIYSHPKPYTTVVLTTDESGGELPLERRWEQLRIDLAAQGASDDALNAIEARLRLPPVPDTSAVAVIAAGDGSTIVGHGMEPPRFDIAVVDNLPYAAPLLEWQQRRLPHLVVVADSTGADIAIFGADHYSRLTTVDGRPTDYVATIAEQVHKIGARLALVSGDHDISTLIAERLRQEIPPTCPVVVESSPHDSESLADETVRQISDLAARATVELLRQYRFLASHGSAVDGTEATLAALRSKTIDVLLIHDDPNDQRRIYIGDDPTDLSLGSTGRNKVQARLVDALIWSALAQSIVVHIIPTTGATGPVDNTAGLRYDH